MGIGGVGLGRDTKIRPAPFSNKEDKLDPQTAALNYWDNQTKAVGEDWLRNVILRSSKDFDTCKTGSSKWPCIV